MPAVLTKPCYLCKEEAPANGGRCLACNALHVRAKRAAETLGSLEAFMGMAEEARTQFYRDAHDTMGKALRAMIVETISESTAEKGYGSFHCRRQVH